LLSTVSEQKPQQQWSACVETRIAKEERDLECWTSATGQQLRFKRIRIVESAEQKLQLRYNGARVESEPETEPGKFDDGKNTRS